MKLVIVGGSAHSTPALVDTSALKGLLDRLEIIVVGRNPERLEAVARAMRKLARPQKLRVRTAAVGEIQAVLPGADLIVLQARYGGYIARDHDERFPLAYDIPGDEGLGPGGLASAWRSWPHLDRMFRIVAGQSPCPEVVLLTAPLGILMRCALNRYPLLPVVGLCELPRVTLQKICNAVRVSEDQVRYSYAGVNHLGWFDAIDAPGGDVIKKFAKSRDWGSFPDRSLLESLHAVPLPYMRLHYRRAEVVADQRAVTQSRAQMLQRLATEAFAAFSEGDAGAIRDALGRRQTPWYSEAVGPYIAARCGASVHASFFFTTTNERYLAEFSTSDVLEIPFAMKSGTRVRIDRAGPLREPLLADLKKFVNYERLAARAVLERSREGLTEAIASHPWVARSPRIAALAAAIYAWPEDAEASPAQRRATAGTVTE